MTRSSRPSQNNAPMHCSGFFFDSKKGDLATLGTKRKDDFEPYWQDGKDWLCTVEFLPTDDPEAWLQAAEFCLDGHATNEEASGSKSEREVPQHGCTAGRKKTSRANQYVARCSWDVWNDIQTNQRRLAQGKLVDAILPGGRCREANQT